MHFVFMLTRNDATVENALDLVEIARPLELKHIGFKDVGADASMLQSLTSAIREAGASPWMEIVATTREYELRGVSLAATSALKCSWAAFTSRRRSGSSPARRPAICRSPARRPAIRPGSAARRLRSRRNAGPSRRKAARASTFSPIARPKPSRSISSPPAGAASTNGARVVVAGTVNSAERVAAVRAAGADAFTIGTAAIDGSYAPGAGPLAAQLKAVLADCRRDR